MPDQSLAAETAVLVRRLVRLAPGVRQPHWLRSGIEGHFGYMESIGQLQRDIQTRIAVVKSVRRRTKGEQRDLEELRLLRRQARRLGDAVAWNVLLWDRPTIYSLGRNDAVPISSKASDSDHAVMEMAKGLTSREWGIPIVHDITDCLRVGDVTFTRFGASADERSFHTVEMKSSRTDDRSDPTSASFHVQVIGLEPTPPLPAHIAASALQPTTVQKQRAPRADRRIDTQIERMGEATQLREIPLNSVVSVGSGVHIALSVPEADRHRWIAARRAIRQAHETGVGLLALDSFTAYAFVYNENRVSVEDVQRPEVLEHAKQFLSGSTAEHNSITVLGVPNYKDSSRHGERALPFFLWDVQARAIREIVEGKLVIAALLNMGRVEQSLADAGLEIIRNPDAKDPRDFRTRAHLTWGPNESVDAEGPAPWTDAVQAVQEFVGLDSVVAKAVAVLDLPNRVPFEDVLTAFSQHRERESGAA